MYEQAAIEIIKEVAEHTIFSPSALAKRDGQKKRETFHWLIHMVQRSLGSFIAEYFVHRVPGFLFGKDDSDFVCAQEPND